MRLIRTENAVLAILHVNAIRDVGEKRVENVLLANDFGGSLLNTPHEHRPLNRAADLIAQHVINHGIQRSLFERNHAQRLIAEI